MESLICNRSNLISDPIAFNGIRNLDRTRIWILTRSHCDFLFCHLVIIHTTYFKTIGIER